MPKNTLRKNHSEWQRMFESLEVNEEFSYCMICLCHRHFKNRLLV